MAYLCTPRCVRYKNKDDCPYYYYTYNYSDNKSIERCGRSRLNRFYRLFAFVFEVIYNFIALLSFKTTKKFVTARKDYYALISQKSELSAEETNINKVIEPKKEYIQPSVDNKTDIKYTEPVFNKPFEEKVTETSKPTINKWKQPTVEPYNSELISGFEELQKPKVPQPQVRSVSTVPDYITELVDTLRLQTELAQKIFKRNPSSLERVDEISKNINLLTKILYAEKLKDPAINKIIHELNQNENVNMTNFNAG